jgi:PAS domain S-box-containing protein
MLCDSPFGKLLKSSSDVAFDATLVVHGETGGVMYMNEAAQGLFCDADDQQKLNINSLLSFSDDDNNGWRQNNNSGLGEVVDDDSPKTISASYGSSKTLRVRCVKHAPCNCGCENVYVIMSLKPESTGASPETTLQQQQTILQDTLDASFDAMLSIECSGKILMANKAASTLFGYSSDEFLGQNISMICGQEHASHHDIYLKRYLETGVTKIIGTKREVPARKKNGEEFPVELGIVEVESACCGGKKIFCGFVKDLSEQKKNQQELKLKEALTHGLVNCSFDPMIQIDEKGIIRIANEATCSLFDYKMEELVGSNISILCGSEKGVAHGEHHQTYISNYLKTGKKKIIGMKRPTVGKRKGGAEFEIELAVSGTYGNTMQSKH